MRYFIPRQLPQNPLRVGGLVAAGYCNNIVWCGSAVYSTLYLVSSSRFYKTYLYIPPLMTFGALLLQVWRRRHYRVKPAVTPGTFRFSVLDNGVVSNEYWRIIDVSDDLSWGE